MTMGRSMSDTRERRPMHVRCRPCGHGWVAAYLPMPLGRVATLLKRLMCPSCGADAKEIVVAEGEVPGELLGTVLSQGRADG
jgi:ribosomal protein L37E